MTSDETKLGEGHSRGQGERKREIRDLCQNPSNPPTIIDMIHIIFLSVNFVHFRIYIAAQWRTF